MIAINATAAAACHVDDRFVSAGTGRIGAMLSYEDCLTLCDLSEEEVAAIVAHEHIPMMVATELANYLCHSPEGEPTIRHMILDDIAAAEQSGRKGEIRSQDGSVEAQGRSVSFR